MVRKPRKKIMEYYAFSFTSFDVKDNFVLMRNRLKEHADLLVVGYEKCPDTGRPHYQGYVFMKYPISLYKFIFTFFPKVHVEPASKPPLANLRYCTKGGMYSIYDPNKSVILSGLNELALKESDHQVSQEIYLESVRESQLDLESLDKSSNFC